MSSTQHSASDIDGYKVTAPTSGDKARAGLELLGDASKQKASDLADRMDLSLQKKDTDVSPWDSKAQDAKEKTRLGEPAFTSGIVYPSKDMAAFEGAFATKPLPERAADKAERTADKVEVKAAQLQDKAVAVKDDLKDSAKQGLAQAQQKTTEVGQVAAQKVEDAKIQTKQTTLDLERSGEQSRLQTQDSAALSAASLADRVSEKAHQMRPDETSTQNKSLPTRAADVAIGSANAVAGAVKSAANTVSNALSSTHTPSTTSTTVTTSSTHPTTTHSSDMGARASSAASEVQSQAVHLKDQAVSQAVQLKDQAVGLAQQAGQSVSSTVSSAQSSLEARGQGVRLGAQEQVADKGQEMQARDGDSKMAIKAQEMRPGHSDVVNKSLPVKALDTVIGAGAVALDAAKAVAGAVGDAIDYARAPATGSSATVSSSVSSSAPISGSSAHVSSASSLPASSLGASIIPAGQTVSIEREVIVKRLPEGSLPSAPSAPSTL